MTSSAADAPTALPRFDPGSMATFDLETTGLDPRVARIVTSSIIVIRGTQKYPKEWLADPGVEIPEVAQRVHGISTEYAREHGRPHDEVLQATITAIRKTWEAGAALVVYNAAFDLSILCALDPSFTIDGLVVDPYVIHAHFYPKIGRRRLVDVARQFGIDPSGAHNAAADALMSARVAWNLANKHPALTEMSGDELMVKQAHWAHEHRSKLIQKLVKEGRDVRDTRTEWPVQEV